MSTGFEQTKEELQRTVREVFRVVMYRKWSFLIPFCVAATVVLISSHRLPSSSLIILALTTSGNILTC